METGVEIEFIAEGEYPGDGKLKPVRFPPPAEFSSRKGDYPVLELPKIIELKLAAGLSADHRRHRDLGDVQALIAALDLPRDLADRLHPWVREEYLNLWDANQNATGPDRD